MAAAQVPLFFPPPEEADEEGFLSVSFDLSQELLDDAYRNGIFPWFKEHQLFFWFAPNPRFVLYTSRVHVSSSMKRVMNSNRFSFTINQAFDQVIQACCDQRKWNQESTWLDHDFIQAYTVLNQRGKCISVEAWNRDGKLVGGFYGVISHRVFCGESMFHTESNAAKAAMIWFCKQSLFDLIDCQMPSPHMEQLGGEHILLEEYLQYVRETD